MRISHLGSRLYFCRQNTIPGWAFPSDSKLSHLQRGWRGGASVAVRPPAGERGAGWGRVGLEGGWRRAARLRWSTRQSRSWSSHPSLLDSSPPSRRMTSRWLGAGNPPHLSLLWSPSPSPSPAFHAPPRTHARIRARAHIQKHSPCRCPSPCPLPSLCLFVPPSPSLSYMSRSLSPAPAPFQWSSNSTLLIPFYAPVRLPGPHDR